MTLHNPVWLHADSYDAVDFRNSLSSLLSSTGGIVGSGDYQVTAPASGMSVNVAAGQVWVPGTQAANQGQYYMLNDGTISVTVPAADPTNPRIDLIVAQVIDTQYGGASNTGEVVDVSGTPAPSPAAPAAPANSITLAQVYVGAGVTSITSGNITDERVRTGPNGVAAISSTSHPSIAFSAPASIGPEAPNATGDPTLVSFTLTAPAYVAARATFTVTWSSAALQSCTLRLTLDGAGLGQALTLENAPSGAFILPVTICAADGNQLAAGAHTLGLSYGVGGGAPSLTFSAIYAEVQVVG